MNTICKIYRVKYTFYNTRTTRHETDLLGYLSYNVYTYIILTKYYITYTYVYIENTCFCFFLHIGDYISV